MAGKIPEIHIQMVAYNSRFHSVNYSFTDLVRYSGDLYPAFHRTCCCRAVCRKSNNPKQFFLTEFFSSAKSVNPLSELLILN
jgi:hypothetical protein